MFSRHAVQAAASSRPLGHPEECARASRGGRRPSARCLALSSCGVACAVEAGLALVLRNEADANYSGDHRGDGMGFCDPRSRLAICGDERWAATGVGDLGGCSGREGEILLAEDQMRQEKDKEEGFRPLVSLRVNLNMSL